MPASAASQPNAPIREGATIRPGGAVPGPREVAREVLDVAGSVPFFVAAPFVRRWHVRWGASPAECSAPMPGDDVVPRPHFSATRAITIDAPPEAVWPWLTQVGFGRAGYYSNDLLDNAAHPSAERIVPEAQIAGVGDWVPMWSEVRTDTAFRVAELDPPRTLLWTKPDSSWAWRLEPLDDGRTRLVTRIRARHDWRHPLGALVSIIVLEIGDFAMMRRMLLGIRRRAEAGSGPRAPRRRWRLAAAGLTAGLVAVWLSWIGRRSGATTREVRAALPGDDLVPRPRWASTRATTIGAQPEAVWPWIAQMGFPSYRGGWYTPAWLDRMMWGISARSADRIIPALQTVEPGDRIPDSADWSAWFDVIDVQPARALVLRSTRHVLPPYRDLNFSWAFALAPVDGARRTRLTIRARTAFADVWPRPAVWLFTRLLMGPVDWLNVTWMLHGIRRRAERTAGLNDDGRPGGRPHGD